MRHRRPDDYGSVPEPDTPWNAILPPLSMGGHVYVDPGGTLRPAVTGSEFDLVASLVDLPGHGPAGHVEHRVLAIPDGRLNARQLEDVAGLAETVSAAVKDGRRVLVRCRSGYNRSGLVVAQALINLGHACDDAVELIRSRRSRFALHNRLFVAYLETGLQLSAMLYGLEDDEQAPGGP